MCFFRTWIYVLGKYFKDTSIQYCVSVHSINMYTPCQIGETRVSLGKVARSTIQHRGKYIWKTNNSLA